MLKALSEYELDNKVIGYTPVLDKERGIEIKQFLNSLKEKTNFVILDNGSDIELMLFLVKTNGQVGLTYENVQDAIIKLNKTKIKENENDFER